MTGQTAGIDRASSALGLVAPSPQVCEVRVELSDITDDEVRSDLSIDPAHWLLEFSPAVASTTTGQVSVHLTVPGPDIWTAALTAMAALRGSGYALRSLSVESRQRQTARPAAPQSVSAT